MAARMAMEADLNSFAEPQGSRSDQTAAERRHLEPAVGNLAGELMNMVVQVEVVDPVEAVAVHRGMSHRAGNML